MAFKDLREFLELLDKEGELQTIDEEIDTHLEIGAVGYLTRLGKASLFTNVKGHDKSVAINILGTRKRVGLAIGAPEDDLNKAIAKGIENPIKPVLVSAGPCKENILTGDVLH